MTGRAQEFPAIADKVSSGSFLGCSSKSKRVGGFLAATSGASARFAESPSCMGR